MKPPYECIKRFIQFFALSEALYSLSSKREIAVVREVIEAGVDDLHEPELLQEINSLIDVFARHIQYVVELLAGTAAVFDLFDQLLKTFGER